MKVYIARRAWKVVGLVLAMGMPLQEAQAGLSALFVSVKVKTHSEVIAGLDAPTRKLIEELPANVRGEVVEMLRQSLPLVEQSVAAMVRDIDVRLEQRLNQAVCSGQALFQGAADEIKAVLKAKQVTPVGELVELYDKRSKKFKSGSARNLAVSYTDYLHNAGVTACRGADSAVAEYANKMRGLARVNLKAWRELEEVCGSPSHCLVKRYAEVSALLKTSDPRDVVEVSANEAFKAVNTKLDGSGWLGRSEPVWTNVETELLKLRMIDRTLSAARGMRLTAANQRFTQAAAVVERSEAELANANHRLAANTISENDAAISAVANALPTNADQIVAQINLAIEGDSSRLNDGEALKRRLSGLWSRGAEISNAARQSTLSLQAAEQRRIDEMNKKPPPPVIPIEHCGGGGSRFCNGH